MMKYFVLTAVSFFALTGCSSQEPLGYHKELVKQQQIYNPAATQENLEVIPDGNGERMEGAYSTYTGKKGASLGSGDSSQILTGFAK